MTKISYLGSTQRMPPPAKRKHTPGILVLPRDVSEVSESEMDLLLARQRLEIEKINSAAVGGPFNWQIDKYDQAIGVVNKALEAVENDDLETLQKMEGYFTDNGQPAIGGFFGKVWRGVKKGVSKAAKGIAKGAKAVGKAVVKVATFPLRMIAKLILEIYLPKAAPGFLYLFADEKALTDKMRAKRRKSEKFKRFVTKKIGMKEKHFMGIIRNSLTKKLRMSPESYLAKILRNVAVKGIGDVNFNRRKYEVNQQWLKHGRLSGPPIENSYLGYVESHPDSIRENYIIAALAGKGDVNGIGDNGRPKTHFLQNLEEKAGNTELVQTAKKELRRDNRKANLKKAATTALTVAATVFGGPAGGFVMKAIQWIINKLGGKKEGVDLTPEDLPNPVADAGNAFNYDELSNDYSNLPEAAKEKVKEVAVDLIEQGADAVKAATVLKAQVPALDPPQVKELAAEVEKGYDPINEREAIQLARKIKEGGDREDLDYIERSGGGAKGGICDCTPRGNVQPRMSQEQMQNLSAQQNKEEPGTLN